MQNKIKEIIKYDFRKHLDILIMLLFINLGAIIIRSVMIINDGYWHIKSGEYLLSDLGNILNTKCFGSWSNGDTHWIYHEWLFGIIAYKLNNISSTSLCTFIICVYYLIALIVLLNIIKNKEKSTPLYYILVNCVSFIGMGFALARPQQITLLFIVLCIFIIEESLRTNYRLVLLLIPLTVVWVNIHGGTSLLLYLILFIYIITNSFEFNIGKVQFYKSSKGWTKIAILTLVLSVLSLLINPNGFEMIKYPFVNMSDNTMLSMIKEWQSPDAKEIIVLILYFVPIALCLFALISYKGKVKASDVAIYMMFIVLFLRSIRFKNDVAIVGIMLISKYAFNIKENKVYKKDISKQDTVASWIFIIANIIAMILIIGNCISIKVINNNTDISDSMISVIRETKPERLYNNYGAGAYLLYNDIDVFIDGRYEPYKELGIVNDYITLNSENTSKFEEGNKLLEKYNFDYLLVESKDIVMYSRLITNDNYKVLYTDDKYIYFKNLSYKGER